MSRPMYLSRRPTNTFLGACVRAKARDLADSWFLTLPQMIRTLLYSSFSYVRPPRHFTSFLGRRSLSRLDDTPRSNSGSTLPTSWLTRTVLSSPKAQTLFLQLSRLLGYNSVKEVAGRRALFMYQDLCSSRADEEAEFWRNGTCSWN